MWSKSSNKSSIEASGADPHGKGQHEPGAKLDAGKLRAGLVLRGFARAIVWVCRVGTYGAAKYSPNGWLSVPDAEVRYEDALMRHYLAYAAGEELDEESGLPHIAHFAWNALALLELTERKKQNGTTKSSS